MWNTISYQTSRPARASILDTFWKEWADLDDWGLSALNSGRRAPEKSAGNSVSVPTNVYEDEQSYQFVLVLPGVEKSDLKLEAQGKELTLRWGLEEAEAEAEAKTEAEASKKYEQRKVLELPFVIEDKAVSAELKDGLVFLEVKKPEASLPREIEIA